MINYLKVGETCKLEDGTEIVAVAQKDHDGCNGCVLNEKEYQHLCSDFLCGKSSRFDHASVNFQRV